MTRSPSAASMARVAPLRGQCRGVKDGVVGSLAAKMAAGLRLIASVSVMMLISELDLSPHRHGAGQRSARTRRALVQPGARRGVSATTGTARSGTLSSCSPAQPHSPTPGPGRLRLDHARAPAGPRPAAHLPGHAWHGRPEGGGALPAMTSLPFSSQTARLTMSDGPLRLIHRIWCIQLRPAGRWVTVGLSRLACGHFLSAGVRPATLAVGRIVRFRCDNRRGDVPWGVSGPRIPFSAGRVSMPDAESMTAGQKPRSSAWRRAITVVQGAEPSLFIPAAGWCPSLRRVSSGLARPSGSQVATSSIVRALTTAPASRRASPSPCSASQASPCSRSSTRPGQEPPGTPHKLTANSTHRPPRTQDSGISYPTAKEPEE